VHRLGQKQPVRVVNFVAQGTIEEGMLSLLNFKRSLFAGVLDGGAKEVFLGGSRLNRFMEVERASNSIPEASLEDGEARRESGEMPTEPEPQKTERRVGVARIPSAAHDPWAGMLQSGVAFLQQLAAASRETSGAKANGARAAAPSLALVRRHEATGEPYLRLPVPPP